MILELSKDTIRFDGSKVYINGDMLINEMGYKTVEDIIEDSADVYIVSEYISNFALLHLASGFDELEAIENCENVSVHDVLSVNPFIVIS